MAEPKFTLGPWKICEVGDCTWIDDKDGFSIAQVLDCKGVIDNAPLLKVAPDMYKLLEELLTHFCHGNSDHFELNDEKISVIEKLLSKARGES